MYRIIFFLLSLLLILVEASTAFQSSPSIIHLLSYQQKQQQRHDHQHADPSQFKPPYSKDSKLFMAKGSKDMMTSDELKQALGGYLQKRSEANADKSAQSEVGKIVGGTKGNAILEFISGAPNKEFAIEEAPDIFDYSELAKYGYSYLATPIMNSGGRREMYNLMGMPVPATKDRIKKRKKVPKIIIDRNGQTDQARYSGLKVMQALDDDEMGRKLEEAMRKQKAGILKQKLEEEQYVMPFADKRNTGPLQTPDWTPERLDDEGRRAGQAMAWARKARAGEFKKDPFELLNIEGSLKAYSVLTSIFIAIALGKSTQKLFELLQMDTNEMNSLISVLQGPAIALILTSIGSCIFCVTQAPAKNRSAFVWAMKGYIGGPIAVFELRNLGDLITRGEADDIRRDELQKIAKQQ
jgi:hypothetical protein